MEKKLWFKAKRYGWGWYPVTWQVWLMTLLYISALIAEFMRVDATSHSASDTLIGVVVQFALLSLVMMAICYTTGEKPRWRCGAKDL